eukprot:TRINITY_DN4700_c0_g1_i1.p1 TRINITY_DN4700_c0_g1~~TRINITY_DN4700_c0_g1_i1.p1  ORF type:complete len:323 (+),score=41.71 TRINITY_DN4700_c0_g1_i1:30-998(+)
MSMGMGAIVAGRKRRKRKKRSMLKLEPQCTIVLDTRKIQEDKSNKKRYSSHHVIPMPELSDSDDHVITLKSGKEHVLSDGTYEGVLDDMLTIFHLEIPPDNSEVGKSLKLPGYFSFYLETATDGFEVCMSQFTPSPSIDNAELIGHSNELLWFEAQGTVFISVRKKPHLSSLPIPFSITTEIHQPNISFSINSLSEGSSIYEMKRYTPYTFFQVQSHGTKLVIESIVPLIAYINHIPYPVETCYNRKYTSDENHTIRIDLEGSELYYLSLYEKNYYLRDQSLWITVTMTDTLSSEDSESVSDEPICNTPPSYGIFSASRSTV